MEKLQSHENKIVPLRGDLQAVVATRAILLARGDHTLFVILPDEFTRIARAWFDRHRGDRGWITAIDRTVEALDAGAITAEEARRDLRDVVIDLLTQKGV